MKVGSLFGLSSEVIGKINSVFRKYPQIEKVIVYGSRSMGTQRPGSDIDLTIVSSHFNVTALLKLEGELDDLLLPYKIDISLLHVIENKDLLEHIQRLGQVFFERKG